ncbi:nuclear transport factor 2 family protein [Pelagibius sp. CAU 1746]|uniref:nuclear transport factor 2 family protein n=1 Tax=Pelagibius sp. CAU 1746 TaxID=3140370 RepID=UPI00325B9EF3
MSKADHLAAYAEGWTTGNSDKILSALSDSYVLDDPNHGRVAKGDMAAYLDGMKATVEELRGGKAEAHFLSLTEVLTAEADGELTAWCWWTAPGTGIAGSGLIKVADDGVVSERLTYYTALSA